MSLITDRYDYIELKEYEKMKNKLAEIDELVDSLKLCVDSDMDISNWKYLHVSMREGDYELLIYSRYDADRRRIIVNEEKFKICNIPIIEYLTNHNTKNSRYLVDLFDKLSDLDVVKLVNDFEYYSDKTIEVESFNNKKYFKDIYDIIGNVQS
ncbi:MAG: hypothetical protein ACRDDY_07840 [Clostridium sp.]|uniref:hypothetical protein n=1 Tax=Clostridium sp. TaxID=1506 RepID=UPI003EE5FFEE